MRDEHPYTPHGVWHTLPSVAHPGCEILKRVNVSTKGMALATMKITQKRIKSAAVKATV